MSHGEMRTQKLIVRKTTGTIVRLIYTQCYCMKFISTQYQCMVCIEMWCMSDAGPKKLLHIIWYKMSPDKLLYIVCSNYFVLVLGILLWLLHDCAWMICKFLVIKSEVMTRPYKERKRVLWSTVGAFQNSVGIYIYISIIFYAPAFLCYGSREQNMFQYSINI